ncbi:hypothetical protein [Micromonospora fulviviridis]|uniref:Uncharacterized protein n=1 Tax=Micromonospora fulviviridis TaxID=47860 RepID=A0ABV2VXX6_9ACTN
MSRPPSTRVRVLLDPGDDVAVTAGLLARHDPAAGVVVVHPTPAARGVVSLAHDLLAALGLSARAAAAIGGTRSAWLAAAAWVSGERVEHLVVLRADRLEATCWVHLVGLVHSARIRLLLVCHVRVIPAHLGAALRDVEHEVLTEPPALATARPTRSTPAAGRYPPLPARLPTGQVLHYRADVYRQHHWNTFTRVDDLYSRGLDAACTWLRHRAGPQPGRTADERVQAFLTALVHDSPTRQHTLALLRGVQAGFLLHGQWLAVPAPGRLSGPGLTSTPMTADVVERIRAGVAHPLLAAGVALALFTGINLRSLRPLRADALPQPAHLVRIPFRYDDALAESRSTFGSGMPRHATAVVSVPHAARPLLRAARAYLLSRSADPRQRVFEGISPMIPRIEEAAAGCGIPLPEAAELIGAWQLRTRWARLDEPVHTDRHDTTGPPPADGRFCLAARPVTPDPSTAPPYRHPDDELRKRWSPLNAPAFLPGLVRAYLDGTEPTMRGYYDHDDQPPYADELRRADMVAHHLAVRVQPEHGGPDRITVHPDIAFALRLTDQPAPPAQ